ncbi:MAG: hypothetical protein U1F76_00145 [Candidatus Competibacteraceae bacterium]
MSYNNQAETRFIELMGELFQLDEAEALDFGLYRIIRRHNREVREFLGEIVTAGERRMLQGGRLSVLLDETFAALDAEVAVDDKYRIAEIEKQLGIKPGMNAEERERKLREAETFPFLVQVVADYRTRLENRTATATADGDSR